MDDYIKTNKKELLQTVVEAIEAAFEHNLSYVEVFKFERSGFVVVISESEFKENLLQALSVLKKNTEYCTRISRMLDMINQGRKSNVKKAKKPKADKKPTKRNKSTKRKPKKRGGLDSGTE
jgi:nitrate reductase NapAB chaperone NapD